MSETRLFVALGDFRFQIERPWGPTLSSGRVTAGVVARDNSRCCFRG